MNRIYKIVHEYRIDGRKYTDDHWGALEDYDAVISSLGGELSYWCENGGYGDYDKFDNMPRSKTYEIEITYDDGMAIRGYIKMMAAGTVEDPFSSYDTCIVMWPKTNRKLGEAKLRGVIRETVGRALNEGVFDPDDDNEIYDVGPEDRYRFMWRIVERAAKPTSYNRWDVLSEGVEEFQSKQEAIDFAYDIAKKTPTHGFATEFRIERFIDTLADGRWDNVYNWDRRYVREIIDKFGEIGIV